MKQLPDLTYKIVAFAEIPDFNSDECIDWALEMLNAGFETPNLLILAGLTKPTNYFEALKYLKETLEDLNIPVKYGEEGIISYSSYFVKKVAYSKNISENLKQLYIYCTSKDYNKIIYDFYLLYWAWDDLNYGFETQEYWPEANKENIEKIVTDYAIKWLEKYGSYFKLSY